MTLRRPKHLDDLLRTGGWPIPKVFVETGTFHGKTTRWARDRFAVVHTVELNAGLFDQARRELGPLGVHCHWGDSRDVLPGLAVTVQEPAVWFLDAHWCANRGTAGEPGALPLADELEVLATRPFQDVVIVDDFHSFGRTEPDPAWAGVSFEWVRDHFTGYRDARVIGDQVVVWT